MNKLLIAAGVLAAGLAACGEPAAERATAPLAMPSNSPLQSAAPAVPAAQVAAQDERKDDDKFVPEGKGDLVRSQDDEKKDESGKKTD